MSFTFVTPQVTLARNAGALYNYGLGNELMASLASSTNIDGLLNSVYMSSVGSAATSTVASTLVANLGITGAGVAAAEAYVVAQLNPVAVSGRGKVINDILMAFSSLTGDATYGAAATAWNAKVASAVAYAATPGSADTTFVGAAVPQSFMLTASAASTEEGGVATFQLTLDKAPTTAVTVNYATAAGTASLSDYVSAAGTVTFAAGQTTAFVNVSTVADSAFEADETFTVSISGSNLSRAVSATGTIENDDVDTANLPKTLSLTSGADTTLVGGAGADTFVSLIGTDGAAANGTTLNAGDVLDGKEGTDSLSVSISGTNSAPGPILTSALTMSNIEEVSVTNYQTAAVLNTINMASVTGVTKIKLAATAANGDTAFTSVRGLVAAEMANGAGDLSIQYVDTAVAGTADSQTLTLAGQTAGEFAVTAVSTGGVETIAITSGTSENTVKVTSSTAKTITIAGDQKLTLTEGMTNTLTTIDASASTGGVVFTHDETTLMNIKGGAGNDTFTFSSTAYTLDDTVDGGEGTNTLVIGTTITAATDLKNVTNIATLKLTGGADVTLAANANVMAFDLTDATTDANVLTLNSGVTGAVTATVGITQADQVVNSANVELTVKGVAAAIDTVGAITGGTGNDIINVTADTNNDTAIDLATRSITGVEQIVVLDNGDAAITATKAAAGKDISITTGAYATALTIDASALDAAITDDNADGKINDSDESAEKLTVDGTLATKALNVTGGAAGDTITGGTANDVINGGAGNDSINGSAGGSDSILGGDGNDTINMAGALTSADTIDGGAGNDTVVVTSLSSSALGNITNVETLAFNGAAVLTADLSFTTLDVAFGTSVDTVTLSTGYKAATTVKADAGDTVIDNAAVALTVSFSSDDAVTVTAGTTTGDTSDTLNITASSSTVATSSAITGVDAITVVDAGDDAASGTAPAGQDITIDLASYGTALKIDASALDKGTQNATTGADEADYENLTITNTASKKLTVIGGGGADVIVGSSDTAAGDSLTGGGGNDTFTMANNLSYLDTIVGGDGTDTLTTGSTASVDVDFMNVSSVESVTLAHTSGTATLGSYFNATGIATVGFGSTAAALISATGTTSGITYSGSAAVDSNITAGQGDDKFVFNATVTLTNADTLNGGTGNDTIQIKNTGDADITAVVDLLDVTKIESIVLTDPNGDDTTTAESDDVSISFQHTNSTLADNATDDTDVLISVDASVVTDTNDNVTVDASGISDEDYKFTITGGSAADTLKGGGGADTISGGGGADSIVGGLGADSITGGSGNDIFALALTASTSAKPDTISDFVTAADRIEITVSAAAATTFDGTNKGTSTDNANALSLLSGTSAATRVGQYFFNTTLSQLTLDADGNGLIQSGDLAIKLPGLTEVGAADVSFVVTDSTGAESITTGGGKDTINITDTTANKVDTVNAGAGDDTVNAVRSSLNDTSSDSINGGTGNDTLKITGTGTVAAFGSDAALSGIEFVTFGTDAMVMDLSNQTEALNITTANGTNSVTIGQAAAHTITGGTGADTVSLARADLVAVGTISGGTGTDILLINTASTALVDADFARVAAVETLQLTGVSTVVLGSNAQTTGITTVIQENAASANTTITSTSTLMDTITGNNSGTLNVTFGDIADNTASVAAGTGNVTVVGGAAGDTITVTGLATASQTFTGSVAKFAVTGGADGQSITTGVGADTITGGAGVDTIVAGDGDDLIIIAATADDGTAESYTGGASTAGDTLRIAGTSTVDLSNDTIATIEILDLQKDAAGATSTLVQTVTLTDAQLSGFTTVSADATDLLTIKTLSGSVSATSAKDTFVFAATDTGITIGSLAVGDVLDLELDTDANLKTSAETLIGDVNADGEWFFDSSTDTLTYWDAAGGAQTVVLTGVATLTGGNTTALLTVATLG